MIRGDCSRSARCVVSKCLRSSRSVAMHKLQVAPLDHAVQPPPIQVESEGRKVANNGVERATTTMAEWRWRRSSECWRQGYRLGMVVVDDGRLVTGCVCGGARRQAGWALACEVKPNQGPKPKRVGVWLKRRRAESCICWEEMARVYMIYYTNRFNSFK